MSSFGSSGVFRGQTLAGTHSVAADSRTVWVVESSPNRITRWDLVPEPGIAVVYNRFVDEFDQRITGPHVYPDARNASSLLDDDGLWILWSAHTPSTRRGEEAASLPSHLRMSAIPGSTWSIRRPA